MKTPSELEKLFAEASAQLAAGVDPEEALSDLFDSAPDFVFDEDFIVELEARTTKRN